MTETKTYHHGDLRNALITIGLQVLAAEGRQGLSLRKVARLAGVSHNAPYMHFEDKEALISAIAEQGFRQLKLHMDAALQEAPQGSVQQLLQLGEAYTTFALHHPHSLGVMFGNVEGGGNIQLGEAAGTTFALLVETVAAGQATGVVRLGDPKVLATGVWAMMHGVSTLLIAGRLSHALSMGGLQTDLVPVLIKLLYSGLRAESA
ncbi:TetR/AcrR family transcriptional regulator [Deinococcus oregonensis]|uniref:TetR/AcrR family transcriptional regulator n=1 Tax=Deinococcus oregonensis TaxID=1805970 RepID=A0ABV6ATH5_9DEIO